MRSIRNLAFVFLGASLIVGSSFFIGCSSGTSDEEMKQLNDVKAEVSSLEKQVAQREQEKAALQKEVADKDRKLQQCMKDQETVKQRLQSGK